jgi:uncharacterized membrane protein YdjX (TVP38/TMEM64 family)
LQIARRPWPLVAVLAALVAWGVWSYSTGGLMHALLAAAADPQYGVDALRVYVLSWGSLAPIVYVAAVTVEVLIAPFPGPLLYAPAGAIFGGLLGGTLSLAGNTLGAALAAWIGRTLGEGWLARKLPSADLDRHRRRFVTRATWVVFLLRVNPLTSSDLVSYAAGALGVPVSRVALGTFLGMIPLCYAQAYLSATIFELIPGGLWVLVAGAVVYIAVVIALVARK